MEFFLYIHYLVTLSFVLLPFLPLKFILDYKLFLAPIGVIIYWLIFDGCHLSKMHNNETTFHNSCDNMIEESFAKKINIKQQGHSWDIKHRNVF